MAPSTIAHYRIASKLGEGGMGAVYRATDTKLNRDVAIKVLPAAFAEDADRMARFTREAQVLASLNHPNIAAIYGVEQGAIVMELVEGKDLAGPLPIDTAIEYARQIAAGLEAAHEKGIVHRDLKPANIKVTPDGVVKLLDFGLAKAPAQSESASTLTISMTQAGMIVGTAAYMSPEQARGKAVDKRADIWAFGVVLFELLTGKPVFGGGETLTDIIAAVVTREPDWPALPQETPAHIRRLLERCLQKDPKLRLRDIGEARIALEEPARAETPVALTPAPARRPWWMAAAIVAVVAGAAFWTGSRLSKPAGAPFIRITADLGRDSSSGQHFAALLSPDGSRLVYALRLPDGGRQLATRLLSETKGTNLVGTDGVLDAFFSPDGKWLGFFAGGKLKKIGVQGGTAVTLCDASNPRGGAWLDDGSIVFTENTTSPLVRVTDSGGTPELLTKPIASQRTQRWPQILPGGRYLLYTTHSTSAGFDEAEIDVLDLKTRQPKTVYRGGYYGRYVPTGHLLFINRGTLYAVRLDLSRLETTGAPQPIADDVAANVIAAAGQFSFSTEGPGILSYLPGRPQSLTYNIQWMNPAGEVETLLPTPRLYLSPRLSPDGKMLVVSAGGMVAADIFVVDNATAAVTQLTYNQQSNLYPVWAPDGKHLVYVSKPDAHYVVWWARADGAGQPRKLLESQDAIYPSSFSPDGRRFAYMTISSGTGGDLWTLPIEAGNFDDPQPGKPEVFLRTPGAEMNPSFSPDGHWMAYSSDETGRREVYVRPFPGPGGKWRISTEGGASPVWSRAGRQLLYATLDGQIIAVDYEALGDSFTSGKRQAWGGSRRLIYYTVLAFDLSPDGKRIVGSFFEDAAPPQRDTVQVNLWFNFFDELKRRLP